MRGGGEGGEEEEEGNGSRFSPRRDEEPRSLQLERDIQESPGWLARVFGTRTSGGCESARRVC